LIKRVKPVIRLKVAIVLGVIGLAFGTFFMSSKADRGEVTPDIKPNRQTVDKGAGFRPTESQWATLSVQPVELH
jgi:hypothetical protein